MKRTLARAPHALAGASAAGEAPASGDPVAGKGIASWAPDSVLRRALWWAPPLFLIHNAEEGIAMARWANRELPGLLERVRAALPPDQLPPGAADLLGRLQPPGAASFAWSAALATLLPALVYWPAVARGPRSRFTRAAAWLQAMFLLNVFVPHLAATLVLRRYTPGVVSALLVNLPLSWVLLSAAVREGVITRKGLGVFGVTAAACYLVLIVLLLVLERMLAGLVGG